MDCVTSGLPISAKEYLFKGLNEAFGEGVVNIIEVDNIQLRSRVRLSAKNVADVLVVLDSVSAERCADIENGLYSSDKYHEYSSDEELVRFLNETFEIELEIKSVESMELVVDKGSAEQDMLIEKLREQVGDRDSQIAYLKAQIAELQEQIEEGDFGAEIDDSKLKELEAQVEALTQENLSARSEISDIQAKLKHAEDAESKVRLVVESLSRESEKAKTEYNQLLADYKAASTELSEFKVKFSNAQGTLNAKDREIEELRKGNSGAEEFEERVHEAEEKVRLLESEKSSALEKVKRLEVEISQYKVELKSKEDEIARLSLEAESSDLEEQLAEEKAKVTSLQKEILDLKGKLSIAEDKLGSAESIGNAEVERLEAEVDKYKAEAEGYKSKMSVLDTQFMQLNEELIKAKSTAEMLEKSTSRDTDVESMYAEMSELRNQYIELSQSVFGKMASYSSPNSSIIADLIKSGDTYNNIRFVFSGSTESRKGTYRSLLDEFRGIPEAKIVIVDATCETCVDYVFEIKKVNKGLNWFVKGGGIMPYLSDTCLPNVKVLSPGLGYINDCYFLTVDWESRLKELDKSGYNVVVYCGDISSLVGRVLHESFASRSTSMIYIHGNAIGARTLVTNLRGLSNSKDSIMCYFEFNERVAKFYETVQNEGHECRVISMV